MKHYPALALLSIFIGAPACADHAPDPEPPAHARQHVDARKAQAGERQTRNIRKDVHAPATGEKMGGKPKRLSKAKKAGPDADAVHANDAKAKQDKEAARKVVESIRKTLGSGQSNKGNQAGEWEASGKN